MQENLLQKVLEYVNVKLQITELKTKKSVADALAFFAYYLLMSVAFLLSVFFLIFLVPFLLLLHFNFPIIAFGVAFGEVLLALVLVLALKQKILSYLKNKLLQILEEYAS